MQEVTAPPSDRHAGANTALVLGLFATAWFSWAQAAPPSAWVMLLDAGAFASLAVAVLGAIGMWRRRGAAPGRRDRGVSRAYAIVVLSTYAVLGVGVVVLAVSGVGGYIAPWVGFVVGAHFWWLAPVLRDRLLVPLGLVVVLVAVAAVVLGSTTSLEPSAVAGAGTGTALLAGSVVELLSGPRRPREIPAAAPA